MERSSGKPAEAPPAARSRASAPRGFPLYLGSDPGARLSLRALRRTLGRATERVVAPVATVVSPLDVAAAATVGASRSAPAPAPAPRVQPVRTAPARVPAPAESDASIAEAAGRMHIIPSRENDGGGPGPDVMAADTLQGDRVLNPSGEVLGKIRDIMLDVRHGRIAYAVLSCGGVLGVGDRLHAVPWSALTLDAERRCFLLDITRERLLAAPGFDRDRWPSMADPSFARAVHAYYGQSGYWTTASRNDDEAR